MTETKSRGTKRTKAQEAEDILAMVDSGVTPARVSGDCGTRARVIADIMRYAENGDKPMVDHTLVKNMNLIGGDNMSIAPSRMYEDKGLKLEVARYLALRGTKNPFPKTAEGVLESLQEYFTFCGMYCVPVIVSGFAVWNGVSVQHVNSIENTKGDPRAKAISTCKDAIRSFLEMCAMDNTVNPQIYLHQNKVYFGAIEKSEVTVRVDDNSREITDDEYNERIAMLQDSDGVWKSE